VRLAEPRGRETTAIEPIKEIMRAAVWRDHDVLHPDTSIREVAERGRTTFLYHQGRGVTGRRPMDFFETAYESGTPPWDIGRPQPVFVQLAATGEIAGDVLDAGCGTGENALYMAGLGHAVVGVDSAPTAVERARAKAAERGVAATFLVTDAMNLTTVGRRFDTVIDSGLFHTLSDLERPCYARNLADVLKPGGRYFMLCFSDEEPPGYGPRRITKAEIRETFVDEWRIEYIKPARFANRINNDGARAWLSSIVKG
jgi:SAM-dependent methyltransferase